LDDFNLLGRYLSSLQGRKNLIWFSASFPLHINVDPTGEGHSLPESIFLDEMRDTEALLSRSQVAVYPVDALGLRSDPTYDASVDDGMSSTGAITYSHKAFTHNYFEAQNTMGEIAEGTGGKLFINSNDLTGAVEKVVAAGANYYTITYVPTNSAQNGYYRKIKVEVARKGVSLAYRRGYYSYDLNAQKHTNPAKEKTDDTGPEGAPYDALNAAMMRGAPAPNRDHAPRQCSPVHGRRRARRRSRQQSRGKGQRPVPPIHRQLQRRCRQPFLPRHSRRHSPLLA
jgi:hypothetical protein